MEVIRAIEPLRQHFRRVRAGGATVGLVPTMGALHAGHLSLVAASRRDGHATVVSIFVNPTQFGPREDFSQYPRDEGRDLAACERAGVHTVFAPSAEEMYPAASTTRVEVRELTATLCGPHRPGHFSGVATVVAKLLNIVQPDAAYFGEKDFQQLQVIRRMVRDLNLPVRIVGCPLIREADGLALSSRNRYLSAAERERALSLVRALGAGAAAIAGGERHGPAVEGTLRETLVAGGVERIDYASVVDPASLQPAQRITGPVLLAIAASVGTTRLIDNRLVDPVACAG